jgi:hypothetical protein
MAKLPVSDKLCLVIKGHPLKGVLKIGMMVIMQERGREEKKRLTVGVRQAVAKIRHFGPHESRLVLC